MFWTLHRRSFHFHPLGSANSTESNIGISKTWQYIGFCCWLPAYLKFHNIAACRCTHQSSPHIFGVFVQGAHVSRVFIVVHNLRERSHLSEYIYIYLWSVGGAADRQGSVTSDNNKKCQLTLSKVTSEGLDAFSLGYLFVVQADSAQLRFENPPAEKQQQGRGAS